MEKLLHVVAMHQNTTCAVFMPFPQRFVPSIGKFVHAPRIIYTLQILIRLIIFFFYSIHSVVLVGFVAFYWLLYMWKWGISRFTSTCLCCVQHYWSYLHYLFFQLISRLSCWYVACRHWILDLCWRQCCKSCLSSSMTHHSILWSTVHHLGSHHPGCLTHTGSSRSCPS